MISVSLLQLLISGALGKAANKDLPHFLFGAGIVVRAVMRSTAALAAAVAALLSLVILIDPLHLAALPIDIHLLRKLPNTDDLGKRFGEIVIPSRANDPAGLGADSGGG